MVLFLKREDTYKTFCTFDSEKKIYHTENSYHGEYDHKIFTGQVSDVKAMITDLEYYGFKKVSKKEFLEQAAPLKPFKGYDC